MMSSNAWTPVTSPVASPDLGPLLPHAAVASRHHAKQCAEALAADTMEISETWGGNELRRYNRAARRHPGSAIGVQLGIRSASRMRRRELVSGLREKRARLACIVLVERCDEVARALQDLRGARRLSEA